MSLSPQECELRNMKGICQVELGGEVGRVTFPRAVVSASTSEEEEGIMSQEKKVLSRKRRH